MQPLCDTPRDRVPLPSLVLAGFTLRCTLVALSPALPQIGRDLQLSRFELGILTTLPVLCMAVVAFNAEQVAQLFGDRATVGTGLLLTLVGTSAMAIAPAATAAYFAATALGIGIALTQTPMPSLVRQGYESAAHFTLGVFAASVNLGAVAVAAATTPLIDWLGSWRACLALWTVPIIAALVAWLSARPTPRSGSQKPPCGCGRKQPARRTILLALCVGSISLSYFVVVTWLPTLLQENGADARNAGYALAALTLSQIPGSTAAGALISRTGLLLPAGSAFFAGTSVSLIGLTWCPWGTLWIWAPAVGFGLGGLYSLSLSLPVQLARERAEVNALSAKAFGFAYAIAAIGPVAVGAIRDLTGAFDLPITITALYLLASVPLLGLLQSQHPAPEIEPRCKSRDV